MLRPYLWFQTVGEEALDSVTRPFVDSGPRYKQSEWAKSKDLGVCPMRLEALRHRSLAHVYCRWLLTAVPDDVHSLETGEVWMGEVQCQERCEVQNST